MIDPFFLCQLESNIAYIGNNGTDIGTPTYDIGKWNNGLVVSPAKFNDTLRFATNAISAEKFSMTFIYHAHASYASMATGFYGISWYADSADLGIAWGSSYDGKISFNLESQIAGSTEGHFENGVNFGVGDDVAIALTFDNSLSNTNRMRAWMNGSELTKYAETGPGYALTNLHLRFSTFFGSAYSVDAVIDNLKLYDGIIGQDEIDWDMSNELINPGVTPVPQNFTASDGTGPTVSTSWDAVAGASPQYLVERADESGGSFADISGWISGTSYIDTTAVLYQHYFYRVKARIAGLEGDYSSEDEGWSASVFTIIYDALAPRVPQILVTDNEIDIYKLGYCSNFISIVNQKTFERDKVVSDSFELDVLNSDNYFSVENPVSPFNGLPAFQKISIIDSSGEEVFNGYIESISRDHSSKTAKIKITDSLYLMAKTTVEYVSADWETPAEAFKNICSAIGFTDYDSRSADTAHAVYDAEGCYIKINHPVDDPIQFQNLLEDLGRVGVADIYSMGGKIYFRHWKPYTETPPYAIGVDDFKTLPVITELSYEMANDYSVGYDGDSDIPAIDSANGDIGSVSRSIYGVRAYDSFDTSAGQITVKDLTSAVYLGECLIRRSHYALSTQPRPIYQVEFSINADSGNWIDIDSFFKMTMPDEGWVDKVFEVMRVEKIEDENTIKIMAYEIP